MPNKLSKLLLLFLFSVSTLAVQAESTMAVVIETQGDRVVINRGVEDGVKVGQTWTLGRSGSVEGKVIIESIRQHSAAGFLEGTASVGSVASLSGENAPVVATRNLRTRELMKEKNQASEQALKELRRKYKRSLDRHTEGYGFVTPTPGSAYNNMQTGMEIYNVAATIDLYSRYDFDPTGAFIGNPWWIGSAVGGFIQRQVATNNYYEGQRVRVDAEVTYWDEDLVDLQTDVVAAENGLSVQETLARKVEAVKQKGVDRYAVFEVHLKNVGQLPAPLEPFKYRIFMMSSEGQAISASRVDPVLDTTLQPGSEIRGMVYFPKIVAAGQQELKLAFEQMFGDRGTLNFSVR